MKISGYTVDMQSSHERTQQSSVKESLRVWADRPESHGHHHHTDKVSLSDAAKQQQASETTATADAANAAQNDPKISQLVMMIERLTGQKVKVFDASQLAAPAIPDVQAPPAPESSQPAPTRAGYGVAYDKVTSYSESEQTTFQASGTIRTSDGKEISFSLNLTMQRQYSETSTTSVRLGDAARKTDPLVINFSGTAAQLSEQRFAFDLNADGQNEQINFTQPGSGFLTLDLNGDGKVNNGSELFGPATGNGFSELAKYDSDGNGWIDESDPVFKQLKVWTKDASGKDQLNSLSALGVGAISLDAIATPFDIKTSSNQLLGSILASSVYLNENSTAGSVQQVDLTV